VAERPGFTGIWSFELPAMAEIGEKSGQPGGAVGSGTGGELVRRSRASYSHGDVSIMAGSKRN
jgi:hypothetical protein